MQQKTLIAKSRLPTETQGNSCPKAAKVRTARYLNDTIRLDASSRDFSLKISGNSRRGSSLRLHYKRRICLHRLGTKISVYSVKYCVYTYVY